MGFVARALDPRTGAVTGRSVSPVAPPGHSLCTTLTELSRQMGSVSSGHLSSSRANHYRFWLNAICSLFQVSHGSNGASGTAMNVVMETGAASCCLVCSLLTCALGSGRRAYYQCHDMLQV